MGPQHTLRVLVHHLEEPQAVPKDEVSAILPFSQVCVAVLLHGLDGQGVDKREHSLHV